MDFLLLSALLLLAFANMLVMISMINRLQSKSDQRVARLERKVNRIIEHLNVPRAQDDDQTS